MDEIIREVSLSETLINAERNKRGLFGLGRRAKQPYEDKLIKALNATGNEDLVTLAEKGRYRSLREELYERALRRAGELWAQQIISNYPWNQ